MALSVKGVEDRIRPIVFRAYGNSKMSEGLVENLAEKIAAWPDVRRGSRNREDMICNTCWNWFSGGSTAVGVAIRIEKALEECSTTPQQPGPSGPTGDGGSNEQTY